MEQDAHGPQFAHLIKTAIAVNAMQFLAVLPQQLGHIFDHTIKKVKGHPSIIISTNLEDFESLMLYTKVQPKTFLSSGEKDFQVFYHIWAWQPSC